MTVSEKSIDAASEGSPSAAQRAQNISGDGSDGEPSAAPGMIDRWLGILGQSSRRGNAGEGQNGSQDSAPPANPFHSRNPPVEDIAVPKVEIVAVPMDIKLKKLVKVFKDSGRTRLPVYEGSLDSPCGFIHLKDLALQHGFNGSSDKFSLKKEMLRSLLYVPGAMRVAALLEQMRSQRIHMALIVDEYGGTDGLVTIEDLVEVIFGDIADEHDDESELELLKQESDGSFLCHPRLTLEELGDRLGNGSDLKDGVEDDVDTLGGLIFVLAGRVPVTGEVVRHAAANLDFEIVAAERQLIRQVRIRPKSAARL